MDPIEIEDPFSGVHMPIDSTEVTIEDINRLDEDSMDEIEGAEEELSLMEIAMAKAMENVNPVIFTHFLCPRCGETFPSSALWQQHLHNVHFFNNLKMLPGTLDEDQKVFRCRKCLAEFNQLDYKKILHHSFSHMNFNAFYKCSLCDHLECTSLEMDRHIRRHMEVHMLKAKINGKIVRPKRFSLSEGIDYEKFLLYMCPECQSTFRHRDTWMCHVTDKHALFAEDKLKFKTANIDEAIEKKTYLFTTCEVCATTLSGNNLEECQRKHYLTHLRSRAFRCGICNLHFNYSNEIKMHMLLLHCKNAATYEEAILPANLRPKNAKFDMTINITDARAKFLPHMEFNCPICGVKFGSPEGWRLHINENHDFFRGPHMALNIANFGASADTNRSCKKRRLRPYCVLCDRVLDGCTNYQLLWDEQLRHTPYRAYSCLICKEQFYSIRILLKHFYSLHRNADGTINTVAKQRRNNAKEP
ncbi:PREDICTED: zinc finger and BTB domain-containing protein 48-like [Rhagoletis zephyria]|uniref:zinc finger and BTB domain-containing protein 48-like n=1 Tax=Rhagoletis zephyria TaxID=28612 RepID=UPI00081128BC|nr:PREDICTED: zinc finger and BTB domain-containing protein 48-like [Rhagoletis zephyria]